MFLSSTIRDVLMDGFISQATPYTIFQFIFGCLAFLAFVSSFRWRDGKWSPCCTRKMKQIKLQALILCLSLYLWILDWHVTLLSHGSFFYVLQLDSTQCLYIWRAKFLRFNEGDKFSCHFRNLYFIQIFKHIYRGKKGAEHQMLLFQTEFFNTHRNENITK